MWIYGCLGCLIAFGVFAAGLEYHFRFAMLLGGVGLLMLLRRPVVALPKSWCFLGAGVLGLSLSGFLLGRDWSDTSWREIVEAAGAETGDRAIVQIGHAFESWILQAGTLMAMFWVSTQRSGTPVRAAAGFAVGIAGYALLSALLQPFESHFGFLANRNHTATLLAMGWVVGLAGAVHGVQRRKWIWAVVFAGSAMLSAWAVVVWSISRAGLLLLVVGTIAWYAGARPGRIDRHSAKFAVLAVVAILGALVVGQSAVKDRIAETSEKVRRLVIGEEVATDPKSVVSIDDLDFRLPTMRDTAGMIARQPWTGVGAGQFVYVFPQYRERTAYVADEYRSLHPESDWLWLASEVGVPAAACFGMLSILALSAAVPVALKARSRSLRWGCLVAAVLVPLHGFFDIPGHVVPLALVSVVLYSLALPLMVQGGGDQRRLRVQTWIFRAAGLLLVGVAIRAAMDQGGYGQPLKVRSAEHAQRQALIKYGEDQLGSMSDGALEGRTEEALGRMEEAIDDVPLDPDLRHAAGGFEVALGVEPGKAERQFAIERALLPKVAAVPLLQAAAWKESSPQRAEELWREAMKVAAKGVEAHPKYRSPPREIARMIRRQAGKSPDLEARAEALISDYLETDENQ